MIANKAETNGGGLVLTNDANGWVRNCTFALNASDYDGGALKTYNSYPVVENCIFAFQTRGRVIDCLGSYGNPSVSCCDIFGNAGEEWEWRCMAGQEGQNGNFSGDPLFCDPRAGDFGLEPDSPCLPGHHPGGGDCDLIGAFGQACGATATELRTWGAVKSIFR